MNEEYDEDYFEHGEATGKSCYTNYRWMPTRTLENLCKSYLEAGRNIDKLHSQYKPDLVHLPYKECYRCDGIS